MPHSFEKFLTGRSGTLAAAWDHAAASAPWATLMREWIRLTVAVRNTLQNSAVIDRESLEKRLAFLGWDLEAKVSPLTIDHHIKTFFSELGFRPVVSNSNGYEPDLSLLDTVLSRREGAASALTVLFAWATETVSKTAVEGQKKLTVEFVKNAPAHIVRLRIQDPALTHEHIEYISTTNGGQCLDASDWINWCKQGSALERLSVSDVWIRLMLELRAALDKPSTRWPESAGLRAQTILLDQLIALRPSLVRLFADRAMLKHRLGDDTGALEDLKRYFAFQDRVSAAPALVSLYDLLRTTKPPTPVPTV